MLVGNNVSLTEIRVSDKDKLLAWQNHADLARCLAPYRPIHHGMFNEWFGSIDRGGGILFAIRHVSDDSIIGTINFQTINSIVRSSELSIKIGDPFYRGRGYGKEALQLAVNYAWQDMNLVRLTLSVHHDNNVAYNTYKSVGFVEEGRLRKAAYLLGTWKDLIIMGLLRE